MNQEIQTLRQIVIEQVSEIDDADLLAFLNSLILIRTGGQEGF